MKTKKLNKVTSCLVLGGLMMSLLPFKANASETNVGVKVTGVPTIDVTVNISADINIDVKNHTISDAYLKVTNNTDPLVSTAIDFEITGIQALSTNAPSTFIDYKTANISGKEDTASKIAFGIDKNGSGNYSSILPNATLKMGAVNPSAAGDGMLEVGGIEANTSTRNTLIDGTMLQNGTQLYKLGVKAGFAWEESKSFVYSITSVVSLADGSIESIDKTNVDETKGIVGSSVDGYVYGTNEDLLIEVNLIQDNATSYTLPTVASSETEDYYKLTVNADKNGVKKAVNASLVEIGTKIELENNQSNTPYYFKVSRADLVAAIGDTSYLTITFEICNGVNCSYSVSDIISFAKLA